MGGGRTGIQPTLVETARPSSSRCGSCLLLVLGTTPSLCGPPSQVCRSASSAPRKKSDLRSARRTSVRWSRMAYRETPLMFYVVTGCFGKRGSRSVVYDYSSAIANIGKTCWDCYLPGRFLAVEQLPQRLTPIRELPTSAVDVTVTAPVCTHERAVMIQ